MNLNVSMSTSAYNHHIMNKMLWMSRQLRNYNDNVSITNWGNAMTVLKSLLLQTPLSLHQTRLQAPQLTISPGLKCTQTFLPSPRPAPILNCLPASSTNWLPAVIPLAVTEITPHTSIQPTVVKRRVCSPQKKLPLASHNVSVQMNSNASTLKLGSRNNDRGELVQPTSTREINKAKLSRITCSITKNDEDPHALPTDKEFQVELVRMQNDAARANMNWEDYLTANKTKYKRCTRYFWCLPDDSVFWIILKDCNWEIPLNLVHCNGLFLCFFTRYLLARPGS